jgi:arsenite methyltransferase
VSAAEARAWAEDLAGLGAGYFFSLNRYLFLADR